VTKVCAAFLLEEAADCALVEFLATIS
jgi:hypothetical protein